MNKILYTSNNCKSTKNTDHIFENFGKEVLCDY